MGLDLTLVRVQAYRTDAGVIVTVSQHYPPPDVEEFLVAPTRASRRARAATDMPETEWSEADLQRLRDEATNATVHTTMDLCAAASETWVASEEVQAVTSREPAKHRGDYGGFGVTLRTRFKRSNPPFEMKYGAGGTSQQYYRLSSEMATLWLATAPPTTPVHDERAASGGTD